MKGRLMIHFSGISTGFMVNIPSMADNVASNAWALREAIFEVLKNKFGPSPFLASKEDVILCCSSTQELEMTGSHYRNILPIGVFFLHGQDNYRWDYLAQADVLEALRETIDRWLEVNCQISISTRFHFAQGDLGEGSSKEGVTMHCTDAIVFLGYN